MKRQIRLNVFETNSSTVHSITICTSSEFEDWKADKLWFNDRVAPHFLPKEDAIRQNDEEPRCKWDKYKSYEKWGNSIDCWYEQFEEPYTTPGGEEIIAFGYYGHD